MARDIEAKLARKVADANDAYSLIEEGDRIMVCVSGGKDSWAMLHLLERARRVAPIPFTLFAFHLDQGHPGFPTEVLRGYLEEHGFEYVIHAQDTYSIVKEKLKPNQTTCSLCSRLRRGIIYNQAQALGATKIALGHHRDDLIETLLLNIFYSGQLKAMPPKLFSDDRRNTVIRPLAYCPEEWIVEYAQLRGFPIIPCTLCSTQDNLQREAMGRLLDRLSAMNPNVRGSAFTALSNVVTTHLLDRDLYDPNAEGSPAPATAEELRQALHI
ncbi:MAG: tRNA 2-thiocytidine(32) synthetase TtcA [Myxococcales bacterium]|nr:tRNA 2-thiocytidine(32) synthetase TtcA [Myxococcales bacterium]